jgi:peptidyl-tRNA hydrolase, PTH1 family
MGVLTWGRFSIIMRIIVGLGNPGIQYRFTRHNLGFLVLDELADVHEISVSKRKSESLIGRGSIESIPVILVKPQTFMNLSGAAVAGLIGFFKLTPENLIVIHDDLDLPFNSIRIKVGGGDGGHKGLQSIVDHLNTPDFIRLRLGIGKPTDKASVESYVLKVLSPEEMQVMPEILQKTCKALKAILSSGPVVAMNQFNVRSRDATTNEKNHDPNG